MFLGSLRGAKASVFALANPAPLLVQLASGTPTPPHPFHTSGFYSAHSRVLPGSSAASRSRELWGGKSAL